MKADKETKSYTEKLVNLLAKKMEIDISKFDMSELVQGMLVELEHGSIGEKTNVTNDDPIETFKIVLAHMNEISDYYTRLEKIENEANSIKANDAKDEAEGEEDCDKKSITENTSKRFRELCGLVENNEKKQLGNLIYQEIKKNIIKEDLDLNKFDIIKFYNDGLGEKSTEEEIDLYKMQTKNKKPLL